MSFFGIRYGKAGQKARARFSKAPMINGNVKLSLFTCKIEFHSFASNMIKPLVSETKWSTFC